MKDLIKHISIMAALFVLGSSYGQSIGTDYKLTSEKTRSHAKDMRISSTIERVGDSLVWCQKTKYNTINRQAYKIKATKEEWNRKTASGQVLYILDIPDYQGRFTIKAKASKKTATLSLKREGETSFTNYSLDIATISHRPKKERP